MAKPIEFPAWRYHKDHEPVMLKSSEQYDKLPGEEKDWHDNPTDAGVKIEVYEAPGGHQKIRKVPGYVADAAPAEKSEEEKFEEEFGDQGEKVDKSDQEDLSEASEDRLREVLVGHGYPVEKLAKMNRKQLLKKLAE